MDWRTTTTILEGLRSSSDDVAWARFVERFRGPIVAFARARGVAPETAEDVAQETLTAFYRGLRDGAFERRRGRLSHWLFGIAANHVRRAHRSGARPTRDAALRNGDRLAGVDADDDLGDVGDVGDVGDRRAWDRAWANGLLELALHRARADTPAEQWDAFELSVRSGANAEEIARATGLTVKAVYNARHRVLERIRAIRLEIEDDG